MILRMLRLLLFPFSLLYGMVMAVRNILFSTGVLKSETFDIPVVSIGNITVGGTGKTPHTEFVLNLLKGDYRLAVLSRGYGRKTKGFVEVKVDSLPAQCGDEPCQMKRKFQEQTVVVHENRREGISRIMEMSSPDAILLDDAYQHRWVKPGLSILLVDYNRPLFKDFMMPTGEMREFSAGVKRADIVIVSKCPLEFSEEEKKMFYRGLKIGENQDLYFSNYIYGQVKAIFSRKHKNDLNGVDVLLLTGIANPKPLEKHLREKGANVSLCTFADHYQFKQKDIDSLNEQFETLDSDNCCVITTEKDAVRLQSGLNISAKIKENIYYIPIEVNILNGQKKLYQKIENYVAKN